jgi:hypothetical protein
MAKEEEDEWVMELRTFPRLKTPGFRAAGYHQVV